MAGYTKLFSSIVGSTIWREPDHVRLVWVTMLALADADGVVEVSVPGLADFARVPIPACREALQTLQAPDPYSRTTDHDGRRIEPVEGGFLLLNHAAYREKTDKDTRREYLRGKKQESRARAKAVNTGQQVSTSVAPGLQKSTQAEAEAEAEAATEAAPEAETTPERLVAERRGAPALIVSPMEYSRLLQRNAFVGSRLRVPNGLHDEFRNALGADGEKRLQDWYLTIDAELEESQAPFGDIYKFLRPRFAAWATPAAPKAAPQRAGLPVPDSLIAKPDVVAEATRQRARREQMLADGMTIEAIEQIFDDEYDARKAARAAIQGAA